MRAAQLAELAACLAVGAWLHARHGWSVAAIVAGTVAWFAGVRLAIVCATSLLGWIFRSPRTPAHRIGAAATVRLVLGEWRALLAVNLVQTPWENLLMRPDPAPTATERVPVVLVHGYFANRGYFRSLVASLEAHGAGPVFVPNFRSWMAPIEVAEEELHAGIERIAAGTGRPRVVLIGHSMGGLVARAYLARRGPGRIARLVTVASPHHGTALARWGAGPSGRQMRPGSAFLAALEASEAVAGARVEAVSIYSPHDNMVAPQATSRLPWARNVALPGLGHIAIAQSQALVEALLPELEAAGALSRQAR